MNKTTIVVALMLASSLTWTGCDKAGKLHDQSKFTPTSGPVELKQKWPVGERIVKRMDMKMTSEVNVPGQPNPIKQDISMGQKYGLTVAKESPDGSGHEVDLEFLAMSMKMTQDGKAVVDFDSENKPAEPTKDRAAVAIQKVFQDLVGTKLQYFLNATNGVDRVEGIDAMVKHLGNAGPAAAGFKNMFNDAYLAQMIGDSRFLPPTAVQTNDSWPVHFEMPMGEMGELALDYTFKFTNWEKHGPRMCARLEFDGTIKGKPASQPNPQGMSMSIQDGTSSGTSWFDPELGAVIDSDSNQDMNMNMTVQMPVKGKMTSQTIKMQMHQLMSVKLDSVKL